MLDHLMYRSLFNPVSAGWGVVGYSLTMVSAMSSSLCGKAGAFQRKAALDRSATVTVAVKNMGGDFSTP